MAIYNSREISIWGPDPHPWYSFSSALIVLKEKLLNVQYMLLAGNISRQGNDAVSPFSFIVWKVLGRYLLCNSNIDSGYHHSSH